MKTHITILILTASLFLGCSSEDSSSQNIFALEINTTVTLNSGDKLVPTSSDARIELIKTVEDNTSEVTLLQGSAKIITP